MFYRIKRGDEHLTLRGLLIVKLRKVCCSSETYVQLVVILCSLCSHSLWFGFDNSFKIKSYTMFVFRRLLKKPNGFCRFISNEGKQTHFGFQRVTEEEKTKKVHEVFHNVASNYDLMNDAMSFGIHRIWKDVFVERLGPTNGIDLLDVAGGTGDIAFRVLKYLKNSNTLCLPGRITVCDINKSMLQVGEERALKAGYLNVEWVEGNAEMLPFESNMYSAYTIAFGIRNVTRIEEALKEAYRVLKPGGRFLCLEFSLVENEILRWLYDRYSFQVIPAVGQVVAGDWKSYQYLVESIRQFPSQEDFKFMIEDAGFEDVTYENLTFGVVAIHSGFKF